MDWKDIGVTLAKMGLPLLGAALPIPGGAAIGSALAAAIGPDKDGDVPQTAQDLVKRLTIDAEARQRAIEFQAQHQERMTSMLLDHEHRMRQTDIADRDSARRANVEGGTTNKLFWLSVLLVVAAIGCEAAVLFLGIPENANEFVVGRVLGLLDSIALTVLAYWFGSSSGSAQKTEIERLRAASIGHKT